jgi:hypothetical protein
MAAPKGNKYAVGLDNNGRPLIFNDPKELEDKCYEYFQNCIENEERITITGLALYLGFCSRSTIYDYEKRKDFSYIIKKAMLVVENAYEIMAEKNPTGAIFILKNMGWSDKQEHDHTTKGEAINISPIQWIDGDKD